MDIPCHFKTTDCPKYTWCDWHSTDGRAESKCKGVFYCKNKNTCSFNYRKNLNRTEFSKNVIRYGIEDGNTC